MNMPGHELEPQPRPPPTDGGSTVPDEDEGLLKLSEDSDGSNVPALMYRTIFLFITMKSTPSAVNLLQWELNLEFIIQKVETLELMVYGQTRRKSGEDIAQQLNQLETAVAQQIQAFESAQRHFSEELNQDIDMPLRSWQRLRHKGADIPICPRGLGRDTALVFLCFFYASLCAVLGQLPARSGHLDANIDKATATWENCGFPPVELPKFSLFPDATGEITEQLPVLWVRTRCLTDKIYPGMAMPLVPHSLDELSSHIQQLESNGRVNIVQPPLKTWTELPDRLDQIEKKLGDVKIFEGKLDRYEYPSFFEEAGRTKLRDQFKTLEYLMPKTLPLPKDVLLADGDVLVYVTDSLAYVSIKLNVCPRNETGLLEHLDHLISLLGHKLDPRKFTLGEQDAICIHVRM